MKTQKLSHFIKLFQAPCLESWLRVLLLTVPVTLAATLSTDALAECGGRHKAVFGCSGESTQSDCENAYDWSNDSKKYDCKWSSNKCISGSECTD